MVLETKCCAEQLMTVSRILIIVGVTLVRSQKSDFTFLVHRVSVLTISDFDLTWFSSLSSKRLCIFDLHGAIYIVNFFGYILFFTF